MISPSPINVNVYTNVYIAAIKYCWKSENQNFTFYRYTSTKNPRLVRISDWTWKEMNVFLLYPLSPPPPPPPPPPPQRNVLIFNLWPLKWRYWFKWMKPSLRFNFWWCLETGCFQINVFAMLFILRSQHMVVFMWWCVYCACTLEFIVYKSFLIQQRNNIIKIMRTIFCTGGETLFSGLFEEI